MTVKELKQALSEVPEDYEVKFLIRDWDKEFDCATIGFGIVTNVEMRKWLIEETPKHVCLIRGDSYIYLLSKEDEGTE